MNEILSYPYLLMSLLGLAVVFGLMLALPKLRRGMLLGGLLGAPFGLLSFEFVPDYWDPKFALPVHVNGHFFFGGEDIFFSFVTGAFAWLFAMGWSNGSVKVDTPALRIFWRFWAFAIPGTLLSRLLKISVLPELPMIATFISIAVNVLVWYKLKPWSLQLSLLASLRFSAAYAVFMGGILLLYPASAQYWETSHKMSFDILGMPFYEVAWAAIYGLVFPMFQLTVADATYVPPATEPEAELSRSQA